MLDCPFDIGGRPATRIFAAPTFTFFCFTLIKNRSSQVARCIFNAMARADITISHPGFQVQAQQTVRSLWTDEDFADVTLASADDKQMKAHKAILSFSSPFFRNILLKNPHPSPLLYLGNLHSSQLQQVSTSVLSG